MSKNDTVIANLRSQLAAKQKRDERGRFARQIRAVQDSLDEFENYEKIAKERNVSSSVAANVKRNLAQGVQRRINALKQAQKEAGIQSTAPVVAPQQIGEKIQKEVQRRVEKLKQSESLNVPAIPKTSTSDKATDPLRPVSEYSNECKKQIGEWFRYRRTDDFITGDFGRVSNSLGIIESIAPTAKKNPTEFRGVFDKQGNMQAAAIVSDDPGGFIYVDYLASAPWNVAGNDSRKMKGAGSRMMEEIVQESVSSGHGGKVKLYALPDAIPFYEKVGFVRYGLKNDMVLTPEAAQAFLAKQEERRRRGL